MRGILRSCGCEIDRVHWFTRADICSVDDASEDGEGCLGLIEGNHVAGVIDATEGEVAPLADCASNVGAVDDNVCPSSRIESGKVRIWRRGGRR